MPGAPAGRAAVPGTTVPRAAVPRAAVPRAAVPGTTVPGGAAGGSGAQAALAVAAVPVARAAVVLVPVGLTARPAVRGPRSAVLLGGVVCGGRVRVGPAPPRLGAATVGHAFQQRLARRPGRSSAGRLQQRRGRARVEHGQFRRGGGRRLRHGGAGRWHVGQRSGGPGRGGPGRGGPGLVGQGLVGQRAVGQLLAGHGQHRGLLHRHLRLGLVAQARWRGRRLRRDRPEHGGRLRGRRTRALLAGRDGRVLDQAVPATRGPVGFSRRATGLAGEPVSGTRGALGPLGPVEFVRAGGQAAVARHHGGDPGRGGRRLVGPVGLPQHVVDQRRAVELRLGAPLLVAGARRGPGPRRTRRRRTRHRRIRHQSTRCRCLRCRCRCRLHRRRRRWCLGRGAPGPCSGLGQLLGEFPVASAHGANQESPGQQHAKDKGEHAPQPDLPEERHHGKSLPPTAGYRPRSSFLSPVHPPTAGQAGTPTRSARITTGHGRPWPPPQHRRAGLSARTITR